MALFDLLDFGFYVLVYVNQVNYKFLIHVRRPPPAIRFTLQVFVLILLSCPLNVKSSYHMDN